MVYKHKKAARTTFRNLPFGALYWLSSNTGVAPFVKTGRATRAGVLATDHLTNTTVSNTSVAVVRVPSVFLSPANA